MNRFGEIHVELSTSMSKAALPVVVIPLFVFSVVVSFLATCIIYPVEKLVAWGKNASKKKAGS